VVETVITRPVKLPPTGAVKASQSVQTAVYVIVRIGCSSAA
jgi:hypothetical protein